VAVHSVPDEHHDQGLAPDRLTCHYGPSDRAACVEPACVTLIADSLQPMRPARLWFRATASASCEMAENYAAWEAAIRFAARSISSHRPPRQGRPAVCRRAAKAREGDGAGGLRLSGAASAPSWVV
jgi:hypothetical protein